MLLLMLFPQHKLSAFQNPSSSWVSNTSVTSHEGFFDFPIKFSFSISYTIITLWFSPSFTQTTLYIQASWKQRLCLNILSAAAAAKSLQSCPTLCDPIDGSPLGSTVQLIPRQEHWSGLPFPSPMHESEQWKWKWCRVRLLATPWTAAHQAPLSMGFSRQEYWSGLPLPSPSLNWPTPDSIGIP